MTVKVSLSAPKFIFSGVFKSPFAPPHRLHLRPGAAAAPGLVTGVGEKTGRSFTRNSCETQQQQQQRASETEIRQRALGESQVSAGAPRTGAEPLEPSQSEGGQEERTIKTLDLFCYFF